MEDRDRSTARSSGLDEGSAEIEALVREVLRLPQGKREPWLRMRLRDRPQVMAAAIGALRDREVDEGAEADPTPTEPPRRVGTTSSARLLEALARAARLDLDRFEIVGLLGGGAFGIVRKVEDRYLGRALAMKFLRGTIITLPLSEAVLDERLKRFLMEAQIHSQLDHPGVVPLHDLGLDDEGRLFFTMPLVSGDNASVVFRKARSGADGWTRTRALEVILKVCDTMAYAHERGVLHRDLKPDNLRVGSSGEVYVMDWGLARIEREEDPHDLRIREVDGRSEEAIDGDLGSSIVTIDGSVLGTIFYMSPEQAAGLPLDRKTDVYAIGACLYELLAGRAPYWDESISPLDVLKRVKAGPPEPIRQLAPELEGELEAIVAKAMARDREQRFSSARELAEDLRAFLDLRVVNAYDRGAVYQLKLWVRRNRSLAASLAAAVVILVVGLVGTTWLAEQNAELAQEKTELAASESLAKENAQHTVNNFNQLSGVVRLKDALAKQDALWPAWPDKIEALEAWLEKDCAPLLDMREQIEATIAELRSKALPLSPEQVEADRRGAPEFAAYERQRQLVASLQRAQRIRSGASPLELPELPTAQREADASALNVFAWPRVAPESRDGKAQERTTFGEEALALVVARAGAKKAEGTPIEHQLLDTLAWAALANGQDEEAKRQAAEALAKAPDKERQAYGAQQQAIEMAIAQAPARLRAVESKLSELEARVSQRRTWIFRVDQEGAAARFLHDALIALSADLNSLATKEKPDVEMRLRWAKEVSAASKSHPKARVTWDEARAAIAKADGVVASTLYAGISIPLPDEAVIGLVPIGMNPVTKLWEFYELRSAWDGKEAVADIEIPRHREDGSIEVKEGTGIVFVLLSGGSVTLGSQQEDPTAPFFDRQRRDDETLHDVQLSPFFLARHELTRGQWQRLAGSQLTAWEDGYRYNDDRLMIGRTHPADSMDWNTGDRWMTRHGMALPTEAQWEYGARGSTTMAFWPGTSPADLQGYANVHDRTSFEWAPQWGEPDPITDGFRAMAPVASFAANAFGLYDVHGNLWEWCRDRYGAYGSERSGDGLRLISSYESRIQRGSSYNKSAVLARSAARTHAPPSLHSANLGLRPARSIRY